MGEKRTKRRFFRPLTLEEMAARRRWRYYFGLRPFRNDTSFDPAINPFIAMLQIVALSIGATSTSIVYIHKPFGRPEFAVIVGLLLLAAYYDVLRYTVWFGRQRIWAAAAATAAALSAAYWLFFLWNGAAMAPSPPDLAHAFFAAWCVGFTGAWLIVLLWCRPPDGRGEIERGREDPVLTTSADDDSTPGVTLTPGAEFLVAFSWLAVVIAAAIGAAVGYFGSTVVWWVASGVLPLITLAAVLWWRGGVPVRVAHSKGGFSLCLASGRRMLWAPGVDIELDDIAKCNCGHYRFLVRARSRWVRIDERYFECSAGDLLRMALSHGVDGELEVRRELFT